MFWILKENTCFAQNGVNEPNVTSGGLCYFALVLEIYNKLFYCFRNMFQVCRCLGTGNISHEYIGIAINTYE